MRLRTLHRRKRNRSINQRAFESLKFCNRFAANFYIKHSRITASVYCWQVYKASFGGMSKWDYERAKKRGVASYYAGDLFYQLKNRLLAKYGKPSGYALQVWDDDHWDDEGFHEYKEHKHILQIVRLKGFDFHQPTGHFQFYSDDDYSGFTKRTVGFNEAEQLCGNNIMKGKKEIKVERENLKEVTPKFLFHLRYLLKKFRLLLLHPFYQEKHEIIVSRSDYYAEYCQRQREAAKDSPLFVDVEF